MSIDHPTLHISLPRAAALTDVLLAPPGPEMGQPELERARKHLLVGISEAFRSAPTRSGPLAPRIRIDAYRLELALSAPERLAGTDTAFHPSPASSRRAIGIAALSRCMRNSALAPARAVEEVISNADLYAGDDKRGAWWEEWFRRLPEGARAVVQAEATTWATQVHSALEWRRFDPPALLGRDCRWDCTRSPRVTLHAKADVQVWIEGRPAQLVVPTGMPGTYWSAALALSALVAGLERGAAAVPTRVLGIWPASGQVRILPVEPGTLDRASRLVVAAAWAISRAQISSEMGTLSS
jgi:hypothetical protein